MGVQIWIMGEVGLVDALGGPVRLVSRRSWALLAYLVQSQGRTLSRPEVAAMLWPNSGPDQARASLRQELAVTRKALRAAGLEPIKATKDTLKFDGGPFLTDSTALEQLIGAGGRDELRSAARLCRGPLLDGLDLRAPDFETWLQAERDRLAKVIAPSMQRLLQAELDARQPAGAIDAAEALLSADPAAELAHRVLIRGFAQAGRPEEALKQFDLCRDELQKAGHGAPAPETETLVAAIRAGEDLGNRGASPFSPTGPQRPAPPPPSQPGDAASPPIVAAVAGAPDETAEGGQTAAAETTGATGQALLDVRSEDVPVPPPVADLPDVPEQQMNGTATAVPAPAPQSARAASAQAVVLVAHLPQLADLHGHIDVEIFERAQRALSARTRMQAMAAGGALLPGPADRVVAVFDGTDPEAPRCAAETALRVVAEDIPLAAGVALAPAAGVSLGPVSWDEESGEVAGIALQVAARLAMLARPGEALSDATVDPAGSDFVMRTVTGTSGQWSLQPANDAVLSAAPAASAPADATGSAPVAVLPETVALWESWAECLSRADLPGALEAAVSAAAHPAVSGTVGGVMLGAVQLIRGQLDAAIQSLQPAQRLRADAARFGLDPGTLARVLMSFARCLAGEPDAARAGLDAAMAELPALGHLPTERACRAVAVLIRDELGEVRAALKAARQVFEASKGQPVWQALALAAVGRGHDRIGEPHGIEEIAEGLRLYRDQGGALAMPLIQGWLAAAHLEIAAHREGMTVVDEALALGTSLGAVVFEPELLRLQAVLSARLGQTKGGHLDSAFVAALEAGRRSDARLYELRSSVAFAAHLRGVGRLRDAKAHLDRGIAAVTVSEPLCADMKSAVALRRRMELD